MSTEESPIAAEAGRERAVAAVVGAVAYACLRVFQVTAAATVAAPTMPLRERQTAFAVEQFDRYRILRRRLDAISPDPDVELERFRGPIDAFYDGAPTGDWLDAQIFHYIGEAITADFAALLTPSLDERTAAAVREALTGRAAHAAFALDQVREALAHGHTSADRVERVAGQVVGEALNHLRDAVLDSDVLNVVLGGPDGVKELVLELLGRHRERLEMLGVDTID